MLTTDTKKYKTEENVHVSWSVVIQVHRSNQERLTSTSKPPKSYTFLNISIGQDWIGFIRKCARRKASELIIKWYLTEKSSGHLKFWGSLASRSLWPPSSYKERLVREC